MIYELVKFVFVIVFAALLLCASFVAGETIARIIYYKKHYKNMSDDEWADFIRAWRL